MTHVQSAQCACDRFTALFARIPRPPEERVLENNFQNVVYIVFMLLGQFIHTEVHNVRGRADAHQNRRSV